MWTSKRYRKWGLIIQVPSQLALRTSKNVSVAALETLQISNTSCFELGTPHPAITTHVLLLCGHPPTP